MRREKVGRDESYVAKEQRYRLHNQAREAFPNSRMQNSFEILHMKISMNRGQSRTHSNNKSLRIKFTLKRKRDEFTLGQIRSRKTSVCTRRRSSPLLTFTLRKLRSREIIEEELSILQVECSLTRLRVSVVSKRRKIAKKRSESFTQPKSKRIRDKTSGENDGPQVFQVYEFQEDYRNNG